jgi:hypothetical protein
MPAAPRRCEFVAVMAGLVPAIHADSHRAPDFLMDCRVKPGNDEE